MRAKEHLAVFLMTEAKPMVLHPPTPYTLSPLLKGGEGRGEGGSYTHVPCPFGALLVTLYHFKSKALLILRRRWACPPEGGAAATHNSTLLHSETLCPELVLHPPTPYTLSPLLKGGEGRGEGGSHTHVPCPFGALLVTLYHQIFSKRFLNGKRNIRSGGQPAGLAAAKTSLFIQKVFDRKW
jgi:hypothetical protein